MPTNRRLRIAAQAVLACLGCSLTLCSAAGDGDLKHPDWHPSRDLLIAEGSCSGDIGLYLVDIASGVVRLVFDSEDIDGYPRWFPDGKRIAFHRIDSDGAARIFVADISLAGTAGNLRPVTPGPFDIEPAPSPDGTRIAFSLAGENGQDIAVVDLRSGELATWRTPAAENFPSWHPDGQSILFHARGDGQTHLYTRSPATNEVQQVTRTGSPNLVGHFSGGGTQIVFSSERDGDREIYLREVRSGEETRITLRDGRDGYPKFSPDGSRIAFHWSSGQGHTSVRILSPDSGDSTDFSCADLRSTASD